MNKRYEKPLSVEELAALPDEAIDCSDIPVLDKAFWDQAKISAPRTMPNISLRVPEEVVAFFKAQNPKGSLWPLGAPMNRPCCHKQ